MKTLLLFTDWFPPAYRAGGPIRSCDNFVNAMRHYYKIKVITGDRDIGAHKPLPNIIFDQWMYYAPNVDVQYLSKNKSIFFYTLKIIRETKCDYIYFNSFFSFRFTIVPLFLARLKFNNLQVVLAPRGMLKSSALVYKPLKKKLYINIFKALGLAHRIKFHATDNQEKSDIVRYLGVNAKNIVTIANFPPAAQDNFQPINKAESEVKLIFLSRIHPIKNLHLLLLCLLKISPRFKIEISILGPIEDDVYWEYCNDILARMPNHITFDVKGEVEHAKVKTLLQLHHAYVLPSAGENFGHGIFESFLVGRPVIISDQTPWKDLAIQKIGWEVSLSNLLLLTRAIETLAAMDEVTYNHWAWSAWNFARNYNLQSNLVAGYQKLFSN